jgi:hypothetical protein
MRSCCQEFGLAGDGCQNMNMSTPPVGGVCEIVQRRKKAGRGKACSRQALKIWDCQSGTGGNEGCRNYQIKLVGPSERRITDSCENRSKISLLPES